MKLYNTLSRKKEDFVPLTEKTARIYSCGPTVYYSAHIGNMRAYIFTDVLKKAMELAGYKIMDVMNITDVGHLVTDADEGEDKMEQAARKEGKDPQEIAKKYTAEFLGDLKKLNIRLPKVLCPATEHISEMIEFIKDLEKKGFAYKTGDGVYYDASKFANYSGLSGASIEGNRGGARVELGEKRNINDFALWKFCGPRVIQKWDSPWGVGCPGWHIECSAMARKYLGDTFDVHTGGIDAIPIHHTNEIAQTEALTGKKMCEFWCHNEFMTVNNGKMSKSAGTAFTLSNLEERGYSPMHYRYFVLLANYRTIMNWTFEGMDAAGNAYANLTAQLAKHRGAEGEVSKAVLDEYYNKFKAEILDDLNTPKALAVLWQLVKEPHSQKVYDLAIKMDEVLSLNLAQAVQAHIEKTDETADTSDIPVAVLNLAEKRIKAKLNKDFASADKLRADIAALGYDIIDTKEGYTVKKK